MFIVRGVNVYPWQVERVLSDIEGLDASILMHPRTWEASGHVSGFEDTLVDCKDCKKRFKLENKKGK